MHQMLSPASVPMPSLGSWREAATTCGFALEPVLREAGISQIEGQAPVRVSPVNLFKAFSLCVDRAAGIISRSRWVSVSCSSISPITDCP